MLKIKILQIDNNKIQITDGNTTMIVSREQFNEKLKNNQISIDRVKVKCIDKQRDKNNIINAYLLQDLKGNNRVVASQQLKQAMFNYQIDCVNLTLTSDGRLVDTSEQPVTQPKPQPVTQPKPQPVTQPKPQPVTQPKPIKNEDNHVEEAVKNLAVERFYIIDQIPKYVLLNNWTIIDTDKLVEMIKNGTIDSNVSGKPNINITDIKKYKKYSICTKSIYENQSTGITTEELPGMKPKTAVNELVFNKGCYILTLESEIKINRAEIEEVLDTVYIPNINVSYSNNKKMTIKFDKYSSQDELNREIDIYKQLFNCLGIELISTEDLKNFYSIKYSIKKDTVIKKSNLLGIDSSKALSKIAYELQFNEDKTVVTGIRIFDTSIDIKVIIPDTVTEIGDNAFEKTDIKSVEFTSNINRIGKCAFSDCKRLSNINLDMVIGRIEDEAFRYSRVRRLNTNATYIGKKAFWGSGASGREEYGGIEFGECNNLEEIDDYAFYDLSYIGDINNVTNNKKIKRIGCKAFHCTYHEPVWVGDTIMLSESLEVIDEYAFRVDTRLFKVLGDETYVGYHALCAYGTGNKSIKVNIESNSIFVCKVSDNMTQHSLTKMCNDMKEYSIDDSVLNKLSDIVIINKIDSAQFLAEQISGSYVKLNSALLLVNRNQGVDIVHTDRNILGVNATDLDKLSRKLIYFKDIKVVCRSQTHFKMPVYYDYGSDKVESSGSIKVERKLNIFSNMDNEDIIHIDSMDDMYEFMQDYSEAERMIEYLYREENKSTKFFSVQFNRDDLSNSNKPLTVNINGKEIDITLPMLNRLYKHNGFVFSDPHELATIESDSKSVMDMIKHKNGISFINMSDYNCNNNAYKKPFKYLINGKVMYLANSTADYIDREMKHTANIIDVSAILIDKNEKDKEGYTGLTATDIINGKINNIISKLAILGATNIRVISKTSGWISNDFEIEYDDVKHEHKTINIQCITPVEECTNILNSYGYKKVSDNF